MKKWVSAVVSLVVLAHASAWAAPIEDPPVDKPSAPAENDEGFEDDGFEDDDFDGQEFAQQTSAPPAWAPSLSGFSRTDVALWSERFDAQPLGKLRQSLDLDFRLKVDVLRLVVQLHGEYDFATLVERERFDGPTLEAYEAKFNTREAYVAFEFGDVNLSFGRLIDVWGAGDLLLSLIHI